MNKIILGIVILVILGLIAGAIAYLKPASVVTSPLTYSNEALGISFSYPKGYVVQAMDGSTGERYQYTLALMNEAQLEAAPVNGEGPTAITFEFYQNNLDNLTPQQWIENSNRSNFKLNGVMLAPITIAGQQALTYSWDGLYRGQSSVITHGDWILVISVTSLTPQDQIIKDFNALINTLTLRTAISLAVPPTDLACIQVITPARNLVTGETKDFGTPCSVPPLWQPIR